MPEARVDAARAWAHAYRQLSSGPRATGAEARIRVVGGCAVRSRRACGCRRSATAPARERLDATVVTVSARSEAGHGDDHQFGEGANERARAQGAIESASRAASSRLVHLGALACACGSLRSHRLRFHLEADARRTWFRENIDGRE